LEDLKGRFEEIEKRVRTLVSEDRALRKRISELEHELTLARREAQTAEHVHGKHQHIREKVARVLRSLEALGVKEKGNGNSERDAG
jgi:chromosome segregation ATPase